MNGPWGGPPWDEDGPMHFWPVEHERQAGIGPTFEVPEQLLIAAAAAGAAGATVLGLLALLVGGVVVAVGLGALVLIGAVVVVSAAERGAR